jgi:predicted transcriptional regulator
MKRSKLETYVDILEVLVHWGPLKLTHVMHKSNVNCKVLQENLSFLIKQELVKERIVKKDRKFYAIMPGGITVLKQFREFKEALPIFEDPRNKSRHQKPYLY